MAEVAWLIELKPSVVRTPAYWSVTSDDELDWVHDHNAAIRFARKIDAERMIRSYGWTEAEAVEHMWG